MLLADVLPPLNATLNALCALLLIGGERAMRRDRNKIVHRRFMLGALTCSAVFLASYLTRVALTGTHRFPDVGLIKTAYLVLLVSHTLCAIILVPMVFRVLFLAFKERFSQHRPLAKITWRIWMYVSVTGVLVYLMLYQVAPRLA
jgi:putative membrane protein